jgi:DNA-binding transcriptional regulator YiaG
LVEFIKEGRRVLNMENEHGFLMDELTWAQRVKSVRLKLNCTQVGLAKKLGVTDVTIALWEGRAARPYSEEAERFLALESELEEEEPS